METIIWHLLLKRFWVLLQMMWLAFKWDITCLNTCFTWSVRSKTVKDGTPGRQRRDADLFSSWFSCCQEVLPHWQRKRDHRSRNMVLPELHVCFDVRISFGSGSGSGGQGLNICHDCHICNYTHPLKNSLDRALAGVSTKWPEWLGSPHMPADLLCQRQCAPHGGR